jgi:hypothetical protein
MEDLITNLELMNPTDEPARTIDAVGAGVRQRREWDRGGVDAMGEPWETRSLSSSRRKGGI